MNNDKKVKYGIPVNTFSCFVQKVLGWAFYFEKDGLRSWKKVKSKSVSPKGENFEFFRKWGQVSCVQNDWKFMFRGYSFNMYWLFNLIVVVIVIVIDFSQFESMNRRQAKRESYFESAALIIWRPLVLFWKDLFIGTDLTNICEKKKIKTFLSHTCRSQRC